MTVSDWAAYMLALSSVTSIIVQTVKLLFIDAIFPDSARRDIALRALNFLVNLGLLLLILVSQGKFNAADLLGYLGAAAAQALGSHLGQQTLSVISQPKEVAPGS